MSQPSLLSGVRRDLPSYSHADAKKAFSRGETEFYVWMKYPKHPANFDHREPCDKCKDGTDYVLFERTEAGGIKLSCADCLKRINGGLGAVGIKEMDAQNRPDRLFGDGERYAIFLRDNSTCKMCGRGPEDEVLEADHIIPAAASGPTDILNGITLCRSCNQGKSAREDEEFITNALIYTHRKMLGATDHKFLTTVAVLKATCVSLNRRGLVPPK